MQEDGQRGEEENGKAVATAEEEAAVAVLPHDLVASEVLTRLPAKYLMRFNCVSKLWGSTISKDPAFSKAHCARQQRSGSSSLFITCSDANSFGCFYATRNDSHPSYCEEEEESSFVVSKPHQFTTSCKYEGATEVINGLFCLHAGNCAWICNVSTHEIRELPYSSDLENAQKFKYFFGCASTDNNRKEYKLLKLCLISLFSKITNLIRTYIRVCEILTIGKDQTWRRPWTLVDNPEIELELDRTSVCIDGSLCCWHCNGGDLIVFKFEDESLQKIGLPPKASYSSNAEYGSLLLQFRGHFALLRQKEELIGRGVQHGCLVNRKLDLWVLELNRHDKQGSYEWINHIIDVPCDFPGRGCSFLGNLPLPTGDRMLLTSVVDIAMKKPDVRVYSYDDTKGKFEKFVIGKFPLWSPSSQITSVWWKETNKFRVHYYEEDITPLIDLVFSNKDPSLTSSCTKKEKEEKEKEKKGNGPKRRRRRRRRSRRG
ncbi:putative F-box protein At1g47790 [Rhododendron vialii]|uniref:putative F-box protein At1g47790 n=1 Tax=Rhododendron vialii TaxID=182163 RepID=UPI00265F1616|nr:putative F-box protein At1g47790 [Rhododendron vialii]